MATRRRTKDAVRETTLVIARLLLRNFSECGQTLRPAQLPCQENFSGIQPGFGDALSPNDAKPRVYAVWSAITSAECLLRSPSELEALTLYTTHISNKA